MPNSQIYLQPFIHLHIHIYMPIFHIYSYHRLTHNYNMSYTLRCFIHDHLILIHDHSWSHKFIYYLLFLETLFQLLLSWIHMDQTVGTFTEYKSYHNLTIYFKNRTWICIHTFIWYIYSPTYWSFCEVSSLIYLLILCFTKLLMKNKTICL